MIYSLLKKLFFLCYHHSLEKHFLLEKSEIILFLFFFFQYKNIIFNFIFFRHPAGIVIKEGSIETTMESALQSTRFIKGSGLCLYVLYSVLMNIFYLILNINVILL